METFTYTFNIAAKDRPTSVRIMEALTKLNKHISPDDLKMLADKVESNPNLIQTAKKYL